MTISEDLEKQARATRAVWGDLYPEDHREFQTTWTQTLKNPLHEEYLFALTVVHGGKSSIQRIVGKRKDADESLTLESWIHLNLRTLAMRMAPQLYERDPRKGLRIDLAERFPLSPLFDRPDYDPRDVAVRLKINNLFEPLRCPFCSSLMGTETVWCGGHVGWADVGCADWIGDPPLWFRRF